MNVKNSPIFTCSILPSSINLSTCILKVSLKKSGRIYPQGFPIRSDTGNLKKASDESDACTMSRVLRERKIAHEVASKRSIFKSTFFKFLFIISFEFCTKRLKRRFLKSNRSMQISAMVKIFGCVGFKSSKWRILESTNRFDDKQVLLSLERSFRLMQSAHRN